MICSQYIFSHIYIKSILATGTEECKSMDEGRAISQFTKEDPVEGYETEESTFVMVQYH
jgi:hypothetical protein